MTTPSKFSSKGLSVAFSIPLVQGDSSIGNYSDSVSNYSHVISYDGGYLSADITMMGNLEFIEDWIQFGLGRHVRVIGPHLQVVWEGYVNEINANMGGATFTRGPLNNIANFVWGIYTPIIDYDDETGEPITGTALATTAVQDSDSRYRYGLWEKLLNIGTVYPEDAAYIRDLYLEENSMPEGNPSISITGDEGELSVRLGCRGYIDWLEYIYNYTDTHTSIYLSTIVKNILGEEPNNIISTDYSRIKENLVIKDPWTEDNKTAKSLISDVLALGGGNDDAWTFGVYSDRQAIYEPVPTTIEYLYHKTGKTQQIETPSNAVVEPWDVLPCKWVAVPTFLSSFGIKIEDKRNDPRVFFAQEVTYTAPDQVTINGARIRRLEQYLAKLGLGSL